MALIYTDNDFFKTSQSYKEQQYNWNWVYDFLQDTKHIIELGQVYLPKETLEDDITWSNRVSRTVFEAFYKDVTCQIVTKPFQKPLAFTEIDEELNPLLINTDSLGSNVSEFFMNVMLTGVRYGHTHVLVDFASVSASNLAEQKQLNLRPNFVHIKPYDLINYKTDSEVNGEIKLTEIQIRETENVDGEVVELMRVIREDSWELYQFNDGGYTLINEGVNSIGKVPLVTYYTDKKGFMQSGQPLKTILELNKQWLQRSSDLNNILHISQVPLLHARGFDKEETNFSVAINSLISSQQTDSTLSWVEITGTGVEIGYNMLKAIEAKIEKLAGQPSTETNFDRTATASHIRESKVNSLLQLWSVNLEQVIRECFILAGQWMNIELNEDFQPQIFLDWQVAGDISELTQIMSLYEKGIISKETMLIELSRRGIMSNSFDVQEELGKTNSPEQINEI